MTTTLDRYGRILIPKKLREALGIRENMDLHLKQKGSQIIIEPVKPETLFLEEDGFVFFNGIVDLPVEDWIEDERANRDLKILGL
ncbi:MAG: AbrB/MazE/SpoVT family DNA-binding domain-containing protein [Bacteroidota bacterium]